MVYFFTTEYEGKPWTIYMGKDKFENEDLIKYGLPHDVWFHVDDLSSAHVYIRLPDGYTGLSDIPTSVLHDCAQLVKANSIEGSKKSSVRVVFTMWSNLRKDGSMAIGQVGFHATGSALKYVNLEKKNNEIVNRINRTRKELPTASIRQAREDWERKDRAIKKKATRAALERKERDIAESKKQQELQAFTEIFSKGEKLSNANMEVTAEEYEADFL